MKSFKQLADMLEIKDDSAALHFAFLALARLNIKTLSDIVKHIRALP